VKRTTGAANRLIPKGGFRNCPEQAVAVLKSGTNPVKMDQTIRQSYGLSVAYSDMHNKKMNRMIRGRMTGNFNN